MEHDELSIGQEKKKKGVYLILNHVTTLIGSIILMRGKSYWDISIKIFL